MKNVLLLLISILLCIHCNQVRKTSEIVLKESSTEISLGFELSASIEIEGMNYPYLYLDDREIGVYGFIGSKGKEALGVYRFGLDLQPKGTVVIPIGQGPGDAGTGTLFFPFGDKLFARDNTIQRLTIYSRNFNVIEILPLNRVTPYIFFRDGTMGLSVKRGKQYVDILLTAFPGLKSKTLTRIGLPKNKNRVLGIAPGYDFIYNHDNERIYILEMANYRIMAFDMEGRLQKQIRVDTEIPRIEPEDQKKYVKEYLGQWGLRQGVKFHKIVQPASLVVPLEKGLVVIRRKDWRTVEEGFCEGDYFDYNLDLLGKVKIPPFFQCYFVEGMKISPPSKGYFNGYLYVIVESEQGFQLKKWKVQE